MVLDEALSSSTTVTRIFTLSVDAGLSAGTVVVPGTARRVGQLHWLAAGVGVRDPALPAGADHGPEGEAVDHAADGGHVTGGELQAGVGALLVDTGRVVRTVSVSPALWFRVSSVRSLLGRAADQGVAHPARGTGALGVVVLDAAGGGGGAGVVVDAGVETLVANTG